MNKLHPTAGLAQVAAATLALLPAMCRTSFRGGCFVGKIDGPIWLAPQEDVVFFCSPGGDPSGGSRRLMMVAF